MKINSSLLRNLSRNDFLLQNIDCISFYTFWDLMVFPGWWAYLKDGEKISLKVLKHRNLVRNPSAVKKIVEKIIE